jgi:replication factor C subunit 1
VNASQGGTIEDRLWVDKYKPTKIDDIIGSADVAKRLVLWLRQWDAAHNKKTIKIPFSKENPGAKAALLSGPPGIGKVSSSIK